MSNECCCQVHRTNRAGEQVSMLGHVSVLAFGHCLNCPTHGTGQPPNEEMSEQRTFADWLWGETRYVVHNVVAHPLLVLWPAAGDWMHDRTAP